MNKLNKALAIYLFAFLGLTLLLIGCAGSPVATEVKNDVQLKDTYRHSLRVEVNGVAYRGVGVLPKAPEYKIRVYTPEKVDRIQWQTCHREQIIDSPKSEGFFKTYYDFSLVPVPGIEDTKPCSLEIAVATEKTLKIGFASLPFFDSRKEVQVPARLKCNGTEADWSGVSVCQAPEGLLQRIIFPERVIISGVGSQCDTLKTTDEKVYDFITPRGKCTYYFVAQSKAENGLRKLHRLEVVGYNSVPVGGY